MGGKRVRVRIRASETIRNILGDLYFDFKSHKTEHDIHVVERGNDIPDQGLCVVFDAEDVGCVKQLFSGSADQDINIERLIGKALNGEQFKVIDLKEIQYFYSEDSVVFASVDEIDYKVGYKLYNLEEKLVHKGFIRISKGVIINIQFVEEFMPWFARKLLLRMKNGTEFEVTKSYTASFKRFLEL